MIYNVYVYDSKENSRDFIATFTNIKEAKDFVINNKTDIWETCFDKAIIYCLDKGAHYGQAETKFVYQYNKNTGKYVEVADTDKALYEINNALHKEYETDLLIKLALENGIIDKTTKEYFLPEQISIVKLNNELCVRTIYCDLYYFKDFRTAWGIYHE